MTCTGKDRTTCVLPYEYELGHVHNTTTDLKTVPGIGNYEIIPSTTSETSKPDSISKESSDTGRGIVASVTSVYTKGVGCAAVTDTDERVHNNVSENTCSNNMNDT